MNVNRGLSSSQHSKPVVVVDYEAGNLHNVGRALKALGREFLLSSSPEDIEGARQVILPGVGSARAAMDSLSEQGLTEALRRTRAPILGICLGMQLFFELSEEEEEVECLGMIPGKVSRFNDDSVKVPHIGWNQIRPADKSNKVRILLQGIPSGSFFYFVHSYYAPLSNHTLTTTDYSVPFSSAVGYKNLWGVQFHPELSGERGLKMLDNFLSYGSEEL
jgi:glutamine amidotransferase